MMKCVCRRKQFRSVFHYDDLICIDMKNRFNAVLLFMMMMVVGCRVVSSVSSIVSGVIEVRIQQTGVNYDRVIEVINRHAQIRSVNVCNENVFFTNTQQIEISFSNCGQLSILQEELFRLPGIISIRYF